MKRKNVQSKEEKEFLEQYDVSQFERPSVTADIVIFTLDSADNLNILLIKRGGFPYKDCWAIPGGFLEAGKESIDETAARELKTETNIDNVYLKQLYTFGDLGRDPRTTVISVAYTALVPKHMLDIKAGISELKRIHETIKNRTLDLPNFRKTFLRDYVSTGKVIDLNKTETSKGKPARLYKYLER